MFLQVPYMTVAGNHEIERDSSGKTFQSWSARYPNAYKQSNSTSNQYYSFDYAGGLLGTLHLSWVLKDTFKLLPSIVLSSARIWAPCIENRKQE